MTKTTKQKTADKSVETKTEKVVRERKGNWMVVVARKSGRKKKLPFGHHEFSQLNANAAFTAMVDEIETIQGDSGRLDPKLAILGVKFDAVARVALLDTTGSCVTDRTFGEAE